MNEMVVGDVFLPTQPLSSLNDLKEPLLISRVNENMLEVLDGLLVICSMVLSPVFVDVTVTESDKPGTGVIAKQESKLPTINARITRDFNNTFLNERKINLQIKS